MEVANCDLQFLSHFLGEARTKKNYLPFWGLSSLGKPCLAMNARALSTFLMTKGDLLKSGTSELTVIPGKCFLSAVVRI